MILMPMIAHLLSNSNQADCVIFLVTVAPTVAFVPIVLVAVVATLTVLIALAAVIVAAGGGRGIGHGALVLVVWGWLLCDRAGSVGFQP